MFAVICAVGGSVFIVYKLMNGAQKQNNAPPKMGRYPLVGSWFHLKEPLGLQLLNEYRDVGVVDVQFGLGTVYYLNTSKAIREAFLDNGNAFSGRPCVNLSTELLNTSGGIIMSDGDLWKEYRRFSLKTLRNFGLGRRMADEYISYEADCLVHAITERSVDANSSIDTSFLFSEATSNVICQLVFGSRLSSEDEEFAKCLTSIRLMLQTGSSRGQLFLLVSMHNMRRFLKLLNPLIFKDPNVKVMLSTFTDLLNYCQLHIEKHRECFDVNAESKDYIDAHLQHQASAEVADAGIFNDTRLSLAILDLLMAGTDTTSHSLRWSLLYMIKHPKIADKVYCNIIDNVGKGRNVHMDDKSKLHYVQATIEEIHRCVSLAPEAVFHRLTSPVTIDGYDLIPDTIVSPNIQGVHYNPEIFPEPFQFQPERHLDDKGCFKPHPDVIAFGIGKRSCLGESLARAEMFVFFCTLMQLFTFELDSDMSIEHLITTTAFSGSIRTARDHKILFKVRP